MDLILNNLRLLANKKVLIAYLVTGLFALLCVATLLKMVTAFSPIKDPIERSTTPLPTAPSLPDLATLHLFGTAENLGALPPTLLQLTLEGVAFSEDLAIPSRAIISSPNGITKVYQAGDTLPGGAIIKDIRRNLVILEENNQLESLKLPTPV